MAKIKLLQTRERCIYGKNPLSEVVAAVRFPRQLVIEEQLPVEFQGFLKNQFPFFELRNVPAFTAAPNEGAQSPQTFSLLKSYDFISEDRKQRVTLASDFLAFTTTAYTRWEDFLDPFCAILESFAGAYSPPFFIRLGLRYKDIISRKSIGLSDDMPWDRLIALDLVRPFTFFAEDMQDSPRFGVTMNMNIDAESTTGPLRRLTLNYGFVQGNEKETAFLIDTDCYVDPARLGSVSDVRSTIEGLHKYTSLAFSASITDELHKALQPTLV